MVSGQLCVITSGVVVGAGVGVGVKVDSVVGNCVLVGNGTVAGEQAANVMANIQKETVVRFIRDSLCKHRTNTLRICYLPTSKLSYGIRRWRMQENPL